MQHCHLSNNDTFWTRLKDVPDTHIFFHNYTLLSFSVGVNESWSHFLLKEYWMKGNFLQKIIILISIDE